MKRIFISLSLIGTALFLGGCENEGFSYAKEPHPDIKVVLDNPSHFTDIRDSFSGGNNLQIAEELRAYLETELDSSFPPTEHLTVTIRDIHLAGDFEPWHSERHGDMDQVRIVRDIYPARIELTYVATGPVFTQPETHVTLSSDWVRNFQSPTDEPYYIEKRILADWATALAP